MNAGREPSWRMVFTPELMLVGVVIVAVAAFYSLAARHEATLDAEHEEAISYGE